MPKPSKVLIIGSGPIVIGQANCHSEGAQRLKNLTETLRYAQGDKKVRRQVRMDSIMAEYYVYIMTNRSRTLYTGITNNLERRVYEHKRKLIPGFTSKYNLVQLAYYEATPSIESAITREKQIKGWLRRKKIALIESVNPEWRDLSLEWETLRCPFASLRASAQGDREGVE